MDEQEFFNKIKELQKQQDLLKKDVTVLECKINELRDILELKNIKKGYYTNNLGLFCKVYDTKELWKENQVKYLLIMVKFIRQ